MQQLNLYRSFLRVIPISYPANQEARKFILLKIKEHFRNNRNEKDIEKIKNIYLNGLDNLKLIYLSTNTEIKKVNKIIDNLQLKELLPLTPLNMDKQRILSCNIIHNNNIKLKETFQINKQKLNANISLSQTNNKNKKPKDILQTPHNKQLNKQFINNLKEEYILKQ